MCLCGLSAPSDHSPHEGGASAGGGDAAFFSRAKPEVITARGSRGSVVSDGADSGVGHESPVFRYSFYSLLIRSLKYQFHLNF